MNKVAKAFRENTLTSAKILSENDGEFTKELINIISDNYDIKGMMIDANVQTVLGEIDTEEIAAYLKCFGYEVERLI